MALVITGASCSSATGSSQPTTSLSRVVRVGPAPPADTVKDSPWSGVKACDLIHASDLTAAGISGAISAGFDSSSNFGLLSPGGDDPSSCEFTITVSAPMTWSLIVMIDNGGAAQYHGLEHGKPFLPGLGDKVTTLQLTGLGDRASLEIDTHQNGHDPATDVVAVHGKHVVELDSNTRLAGPKALETLTAWILSRLGPPGA
jgi:hypothetical protein